MQKIGKAKFNIISLRFYMFQRRRSIRQAGFIRRHQASKMISMESCIQINDTQEQFSPFKDFSPEPIETILQSYRQKSSRHILVQYQSQTTIKQSKKIEKHVKIQNDRRHSNLVSMNEMEEKQYQKICKKYSKRNQIQCRDVHEAKSKKPAIITQCNQQILEITCKPEKITLSLAEAFSLRCHKIKQKLQDERQKFGRSKAKIHRETSISVTKVNNKQHILNKTCVFSSKPAAEDEKLSQINFIKLKHRKSDGDTRRSIEKHQRNEENKENCEQNSNINSCNTSRKLKSNNFYIPAPSNKSRPITPKQAYEHSLKKWKQLPQVKAKQKQRQRQTKMKERLIKMRAHSLQVRNKLRR